MFPIDISGFPQEEHGLTAEQFLRRLPPVGWRGADCTSGQTVGRADRVTVFLDRSWPSLPVSSSGSPSTQLNRNFERR